MYAHAQTQGLPPYSPAFDRDPSIAGVNELPVSKELAASAAIDTNKEELVALGVELWSKPELGCKEFNSHKVLTDILKKKGFSVERG